MNLSTRKLTQLALFAALMCVVSPFTIPTGLVPLSLATLVLYLAAAVLGTSGTISIAVYLLLGAVGLPVFSGGLGGLDRLIGPTVGYLVGYIPCALVAGFIIDRFENKKFAYPIAMIAGTVVLYALGTAWFMILMGANGSPYTLGAALWACVIKFLPGDAVKIIVASTLGYVLRTALAKNLKKAG